MNDIKDLQIELENAIDDNLTCLSLEAVNCLKVGVVFPYSIFSISNSKGEIIFELIQNEDGTVESKGSDIGEAAEQLFSELTRKSQEYALSYLKNKDK